MVNALGQGKYVLYVNGKQYSAVLINPMQSRQSFANESGEPTRLDIVVLSVNPEYAILRGATYNLPEIDTPQPDKNKIPPDMVRIPDKPNKDRVPLRIPWNPDKIPKKRNPSKKKRDPFGIVN